ncbi:uncharacterized protein METZ01_LOCUS85398, partial [marine metagenome]
MYQHLQELRNLQKLLEHQVFWKKTTKKNKKKQRTVMKTLINHVLL